MSMRHHVLSRHMRVDAEYAYKTYQVYNLAEDLLGVELLERGDHLVDREVALVEGDRRALVVPPLLLIDGRASDRVQPDRLAHAALLHNRDSHRCNFHVLRGTVSALPDSSWLCVVAR